jgi:hypothetical protein
VSATERDTDPLAAAVGAAPPEELANLSDDDRTALAATVERAIAERNAMIDDAIESSLRHLPALLRGPVKRALGV